MISLSKVVMPSQDLKFLSVVVFVTELVMQSGDVSFSVWLSMVSVSEFVMPSGTFSFSEW